MNARIPLYNLAMLFGLGALITLGASVAYAETEDSAKDVVEATLDVDFNEIESLGLYGKTSEGSLGKSLWKNSTRSSIVSLLKNMPATSETPDVNALIFGVLLTRANPKLLENDIAPESGGDLLTLRLEKLIEAGAYSTAFEIYSQLKSEAYHERLARTGVLAMLYGGDKSLACLETNILFKRFTNVEFWKTLSAYCDVSLSEEPNQSALDILGGFSENKILNKLSTDKDYRFIYTDKAYSRLQVLEQALLAAEERLDVSQTSIAVLSKAPAAHIQPLLGLDTLSQRERFTLTLRAVKLGLYSADTLNHLYADKASPSEVNGSKDWTQLSALYKAAQDTPDSTEQWGTLRKALPFIQEFGSSALLPYARLIQRTKPVDATLSEVLAAYKVLQRAQINIPDHWISAYRKIPFDKKDALQHAKILTVNVIMQPHQKKNKENLESIFAALQTKNPRELLLLQRILSKFDKQTAKNYTQNNIYEKDFHLTSSEDYVMQSGVVWDRLLKTSNAKAIGETVLLNVILLHKQNLQNIYPGLFGDVLQSTENVSLTSISKSLAIKASLGD